MADVVGGTVDVGVETADMAEVVTELVVVVHVLVLVDIVAADSVDMVTCTVDVLTSGACTVVPLTTGSAQL